MLHTILGAKQKMSATYIEGTRIPVTWVQAGPCVVTQIKKQDKDGYWAVQLGFQTKKLKNTSKPLQGHLKGALKDKTSLFFQNNKAPRFLREVRMDTEPDMQVGDEITITKIFRKGDIIAVTGISKGKGFAGGVKRWGFRGGPKTHGQSDRHRAPGSIGQGTTPGRVLKGKHMAGRMGSDTVTIKNLMIVDVDPTENKLAISGGIPGNPGSLLIIRRISEGSLEDLVEEVPEVEMQVEEEEDEKKEEVQAEGGSNEAAANQEEAQA
jgi:large subunit ribosomal protein L3